MVSRCQRRAHVDSGGLQEDADAGVVCLRLHAQSCEMTKKIREVFPAVHGLRRLGEPPEVPAACQSLLQARARSAAYVKRSVHETAA